MNQAYRQNAMIRSYHFYNFLEAAFNIVCKTLIKIVRLKLLIKELSRHTSMYFKDIPIRVGGAQVIHKKFGSVM